MVAGVFGSALASFLDVLADCLPRGERPVGRSRCAHCRRALAWFELVPVFSWLWLRGRCRTCGSRIPVRHLLVEGGLGALFAYATYTTLTTTETVGTILTTETAIVWLLLAFRLLLLSTLTVVFLADLRYFIIPDVVSLGLAALFVLALLLGRLMDFPVFGVLPSFRLALLGGAFGAAFLAVFALVSKGAWMGWGDVKLALALGLAFGFPAVLFLLAFAFILGAVAGLALLALRLRGAQDLLPFGPFIVLASLPFIFGYTERIEYFFGVTEFLQ